MYDKKKISLTIKKYHKKKNDCAIKKERN